MIERDLGRTEEIATYLFVFPSSDLALSFFFLFAFGGAVLNMKQRIY